MLTIAVNGRFLSRPLTGVDRVAEEVLVALDALLSRDETLRGRIEVLLLTPPDTRRSLGLAHVRERRVGTRTGHAWEQIDLPAALEGAWLVSPCNTGPLRVEKSLTIIHDAQVYLTPGAYGRAFRWWYKVLLPLLGRRSRLVATVSNYSKGQLERFGVVPRGKLKVVPNGCDHIDRIAADPEIVERSGLTPGGYFLAIGSLSPHKNIRMLLRADALRRNRDLPIVVAGGSNVRIFTDAGFEASDTVRYLGRVADGELKALYEGAAALLFPSFFEGFGLPPAEAMRCGCPVVASTAEAVMEVCGDAALYADPADAGAWAAHMDALAADPDLRRRLADAGRARAGSYLWRDAAGALFGAILSAEGLGTDGLAAPAAGLHGRVSGGGADPAPSRS